MATSSSSLSTVTITHSVSKPAPASLSHHAISTATTKSRIGITNAITTTTKINNNNNNNYTTINNLNKATASTNTTTALNTATINISTSSSSSSQDAESRSGCRRSLPKKINCKDYSNRRSSSSSSSCSNYCSNSSHCCSCSSCTSSSRSCGSCSSNSSSSNKRRDGEKMVVVPLDAPALALQRRVAFSRSRSLSESRPPWAGRDGIPECRREAQSRFCRVRSFKSTRKGLIRNGESIKSTDTKTFMSTGSVRVYRKLSTNARSESMDSTDSSVGGSSVAESYYRVCVLGARGVGRSTLVKRFFTSEEQAESPITSGLGGFGRRQVVTVSVQLDGQESLLEFWDHSLEIDEGIDTLESLDSSTTTLTSGGYNVSDDVSDDDVSDDVFESGPSQSDAYTVVFALNDQGSFRLAESFLRHLREERGTDRAITLVGNKSDLVRQRHVSNKDACSLAHRYDCKYIETSAVLGHQTDELLVGTLRQIRLKLCTIATASPDYDAEALDDVRETSKKHHHQPPHLKWQKIMHLYRFLHGAPLQSSQSVDSCQNFFV